MQFAPRWLGYAALAVVFYLVVHYAVEIVVSLALGEAAYATAWDAALYGFVFFEVGAAIAMAWGVARSGRRSGRSLRGPVSALAGDSHSGDQAEPPDGRATTADILFAQVPSTASAAVHRSSRAPERPALKPLGRRSPTRERRILLEKQLGYDDLAPRTAAPRCRSAQAPYDAFGSCLETLV
jgi:hypothetical protein